MSRNLIKYTLLFVLVVVVNTICLAEEEVDKTCDKVFVIYNVHSDDIVGKELITTISQRLPPNASAILIGDIDLDVLSSNQQQQQQESEHQSNNKNYKNNNDKQQSNHDHNDNKSKYNNNNNNNSKVIITKNKRQLPGQIGSLVMAKEEGGEDIDRWTLKGQLNSEERPTNLQSMSSSYSPPYSSANAGSTTVVVPDFTTDMLTNTELLDEFYQTLLSKLDKKELELYLEKLKRKQLLLRSS
ncbi:hypothetical protein PPL_01350 [Heterostelium album PN500]|uniref:Uncharacterized protein n=1 Tax=Heterostelium pallidum (strain ATCC 26659 / Pp 5 / PN500) TaxID=670386 RepID=D3AZ10_HETP5|nr:hypothetical protein PPL_01350 [Heterostelium album PN500]EFA85567.1 hypothetical protein PPL_01350 [Heterostelium album PN500]|eukprot:XP_020437674.1 hypothetical protein PPL_01350 [Heterostelium album PN500]